MRSAKRGTEPIPGRDYEYVSVGRQWGRCPSSFRRRLYLPLPVNFSHPKRTQQAQVIPVRIDGIAMNP